MDGIIRTVGDGSKAVQVLQMTRDRDRERDVAIHGRQRLQGHGTVISYRDDAVRLKCYSGALVSW